MRISDWSSDVCSSDLATTDTAGAASVSGMTVLMGWRCSNHAIPPWPISVEHIAEKATAPKASGPMAKRPVIAPGSNLNTTGASPADRKSLVQGTGETVSDDLGGRSSI